MDRKKFGRIGQCATERALRDGVGKLKILTQREETYLPTIDFVAAKTAGIDVLFRVHVQVKTTSKNYREGFNIHWRQLDTMLNGIAQTLHMNPGDHFILAVVSLPRQHIATFDFRTLVRIRDDAKEEVGVDTMPGMQVIPWDLSRKDYLLTSEEVNNLINVLEENDRPTHGTASLF